MYVEILHSCCSKITQHSFITVASVCFSGLSHAANTEYALHKKACRYVMMCYLSIHEFVAALESAADHNVTFASPKSDSQMECKGYGTSSE